MWEGDYDEDDPEIGSISISSDEVDLDQLKNRSSNRVKYIVTDEAGVYQCQSDVFIIVVRSSYTYDYTYTPDGYALKNIFFDACGFKRDDSYDDDNDNDNDNTGSTCCGCSSCGSSACNSEHCCPNCTCSMDNDPDDEEEILESIEIIFDVYDVTSEIGDSVKESIKTEEEKADIAGDNYTYVNIDADVNLIGNVSDIGDEKVTFTIDTTFMEETYGSFDNVYVMRTSDYEVVPAIYDPEARTVTFEVSKFTTYALSLDSGEEEDGAMPAPVPTEDPSGTSDETSTQEQTESAISTSTETTTETTTAAATTASTGTSASTATQEATTNRTSTATTSDTVKTGDRSNVSLYIIMELVAAGIGGFVIRKLVRHR